MTTQHTGYPQAVSLEDVRTVRRMVVMASHATWQDVCDIAQEVLCALAFRRHPIEVPAGMTPVQARTAFLWGVVRRQVVHHAHRHARFEVGLVLGREVLARPPAPSPEDLHLALAESNRLSRAIEQLHEARPELHEVLVLVAEEQSISRIAARLGIPAGTVSSRWLRAREAVRAFVRRDVADEATAGRTAFIESIGAQAA